MMGLEKDFTKRLGKKAALTLLSSLVIGCADRTLPSSFPARIDAVLQSIPAPAAKGPKMHAQPFRLYTAPDILAKQLAPYERLRTTEKNQDKRQER